MNRKKVVIIGGGFGGLNVALGLKNEDIELLVVDKTNHHLFQPLLYQVATAAISASTIAPPIREVLRKQLNATVIMNEVIKIDRQNKLLYMLNGEIYPYDSLVVATGAVNNYFGHDEWHQVVFNLKTIADALRIREQILFSFELAENCATIEEARKYLRFLIIGGGPTGVEMAGAIAEVARTPMFKKYKLINQQNTEIYLIEGLPHILPMYPTKLSLRAKQDLENLGVKVLVDTKVTNISDTGVYINDYFLESTTIIWAAGNQGTPLLQHLDTPLDRMGRAIVDQDLSLPQDPNVFVIGDTAAFNDPKIGILPAVAPVAMQQGKYVAKIIAKETPKMERKPFKYFDKGSMATIGRAKAIAIVGKLSFTGLFAWLMWSVVHVMYLISFRNRFIVMIEWISLFITGRRNAFYIIQDISGIEEKIAKRKLRKKKL